MQNHIIIGTSAAALGVLNKLRQLDQTANIICISDESEFPYNKCFLADYVSGTKALEAVYTKPESFFLKNTIRLMLGTRAVGLNVQEKTVRLDDGQSLVYDSLFIGTGSSPYIPSFLNDYENSKGIFSFHTLADSVAIMNFLQKQQSKKALVVGAGLSGLEAADSLASQGLNVSVLSRHGQLIRRHINQEASRFIESKMKNAGIELLTGLTPKELLTKGDKVCGVRMTDTSEIEADLVIVATGLKPNTELAEQAGLVMKNGYLVTNDSMQTSDPSVWAGGDCCLVKDRLTGELVPSTLWPDAMLQGVVAAHSMTGNYKAYPGVVPMINSAFFGTQLVVAGAVKNVASTGKAEVQQGNDFYHLLIKEDQRIKGFILLGQTGRAPELKRALLTGQ